MSTDLNTRCTTALRALEGAGVIRSAWLRGHSTNYKDIVISAEAHLIGKGVICYGDTPDDQLLDLSDPVTAASLIVLVREAYSAHAHCVRTTGGAWGVWVFDDSHGPARSSSRVSLEDTEAEALVAALEAKVREVCGG